MPTSLSLGQKTLNPEPPVTGEAYSPSASEANADPLVGKVLNGRFAVLDLIGTGGMGRVYKAMQAPLDRLVALKVLNPHYSVGRDPGFQKRFFLEASMTAKLHHPNTITIIDYGRTRDGIFYIAMEYVRGVTLAEVLATNGPIEWVRVVNIAQQICRSLREAHKLGIVHRDLKPANIMLLSDENEHDMVKVLDFGLVKSFLPDSQNPVERDLTQAGVLLGSPMYMAPEQAKNQVDPRSDVYSLGLVMYQMLAGKPPFRSREAIDIILKHVKEPPPPLRTIKPDIQVPRELEAVVFRCLEKDPGKRFQSMDEMLDAIRRLTAASEMTGTLSRPLAVKRITPLSRPYRPTMGEAGNNDETFAIKPLSNVRERSNAVVPRKKRIQLKRVLISATVLVSVVGVAVLLRLATAARELEPPRPLAPAPLPSESKFPEPTQSTVDARPVVPKKVHFVVSSEPSGANVTMEGRNLGRTPVEFQLDPDQEGIATAQLVLSMEGFERTTVTASGSGPEVVLNQQLQRKTRVRKASSNALGYKDDPYQ